jgi:hypothetical protein
MENRSSVLVQLYQFMVTPFGLTNAPATFQDMMNHILKDLLDNGLIVYIDDILINAKLTEKYVLIVIEVFKRLVKNNIVISPKKGIWSSERVEFLGYVITPDRTEMIKDKFEEIREWQAPRSLRDFQSFLAFANINQRFIKDVSRIYQPLKESTKVDNTY